MKNKYTGVAVNNAGISLFQAVKLLCMSALSIKTNISVLDDGEWDYKLNKVFTSLKADIEEISKIDQANSYKGNLTIDILLTEFYDFYELLTYIDPLGREELSFVVAYQLIEEKIKEEKGKFLKKDYPWEDMHSKIRYVSKERYLSGHYADAVEAAYKEIIKRVKEYIKLKTNEKFDGDKAMNKAFGFENQTPLIKFNNLLTDEEKDEQKGIMNLFKGIVGIRNRKAHENVILDNSVRALEYIFLASLLMNLLDEHEN